VLSLLDMLRFLVIVSALVLHGEAEFLGGTSTAKHLIRKEKNSHGRALEVDGLEGVMNEEPDVPDVAVGAEASQLVDNTRSGGMVSRNRKVATVNLALLALSVPGDFVETGVNTGGTSVLMAKVLQKDSSRSLWAADSFEGLPAEDTKEVSREDQDKEAPRDVNIKDDEHNSALGGMTARVFHGGSTDPAAHKGAMTASRAEFEANLESNGLGNSKSNPKIKVLQGWFSDTLPKAPISKIAFLGLDGDIYISTTQAITNLYDKVVPGGYIYVDDYGSFVGCKHAIDEFRKKRGITETMHPIKECRPDCDKYEAVWWRKAL